LLLSRANFWETEDSVCDYSTVFDRMAFAGKKSEGF
jgi:hypothetical protein